MKDKNVIKAAAYANTMSYEKKVKKAFDICSKKLDVEQCHIDNLIIDYYLENDLTTEEVVIDNVPKKHIFQKQKSSGFFNKIITFISK